MNAHPNLWVDTPCQEPNIRARRVSTHSQRDTLTIFSGFRVLLEAIIALGEAVEVLAKAQTSATPSMDRLDALELSRHAFEAQMEGLYLKAEGKLKAAANAEARERHQRETYEANFDTVPEAGGEGSGASPILPDDAEAGEAARVSSLNLGVAPNHKATALAHKFGR